MPYFSGGYASGINMGGIRTNIETIPAGGTRTIPAGWNVLQSGPYTFNQWFDPVKQAWTGFSPMTDTTIVHSDGSNYRVANLTGCVIDAWVTNAGSGYTSAPVVAFNQGGATAVAVMGQVVSTTVTIVNGGANYTIPPRVVIDAPNKGGTSTPGVSAQGYATLTGGVVTSVTITDQGAGYGSITGIGGFQPQITFSTDPTDPNASSSTTPITPATATLALTGAGTVNAVIVTYQGTPQTSVSTISFSGGGGTGAAATALMALTVTAQTVSAGGTGFVSGTKYLTSNGFVSEGTSAYLISNRPTMNIRDANGVATVSGGTAITAITIDDGGIFEAVPVGVIINANGSGASGLTLATPTVGGVTDWFIVQPQA